jgi:hypothetical protein
MIKILLMIVFLAEIMFSTNFDIKHLKDDKQITKHYGIINSTKIFRYMQLFGLTLLKPYYDNNNTFNYDYFISPPKPSPIFSNYAIKTTLLTKTLYYIRAEGIFTSKEKCEIALNSTIKYSMYWNKSIEGGIMSTFYINKSGKVENINEGITFSKDLIKVHVECDKINNKSWKGTVILSSEYGKKIYSLEKQLIRNEK